MRQPETNRESRAISLRLAVTFAWSTVKTHFGLFARVLLTLLGAWVALEIVVITGQRFGILLWTIAHLVFLIVFAGVELGILHVCLAFHEGKEPTFADAFKNLELGPKFLAGQVLYILLVAIGLPLLIFPGVYAGVRCSLFGFSMAAGEVDLIRSFKQSAILTEGSTMRLFWILMALLLLNVLGAALLGIGLFITLPLSTLTLTGVYQQLSRAS
jgi:hypothetical protein